MEMYKKYEKQPDSKIYEQVVNACEYIETNIEQSSVGFSTPTRKMVFRTRTALQQQSIAIAI